MLLASANETFMNSENILNFCIQSLAMILSLIAFCMNKTLEYEILQFRFH
jgi:hypothetical protein